MNREENHERRNAPSPGKTFPVRKIATFNEPGYHFCMMPLASIRSTMLPGEHSGSTIPRNSMDGIQESSS